MAVYTDNSMSGYLNSGDIQMGMKTYLIRKGSHYSCHLPKLWFGSKDSITIEFRFSESCWFPMRDKEDFAINKLAGFSHGFHHRNSIRVGWKPSPDRIGWIELYIYVYSNGHRKEYFINSVECGHFRSITLNYDKFFSTLSYSLSGPIVTSNGSMYLPLSVSKWGYYLFPYFGGTKTSHADLRIDLEFK